MNPLPSFLIIIGLLIAGPSLAQNPYCYVKKDGKFGFIDTTGSITIDLQYENAVNFSEGLAPVKKDGKWGYIDHENIFVIPPVYDMAHQFRNGFALVWKEGKQGVIDKSNKIILPIEYERVIFEGERMYSIKDDDGTSRLFNAEQKRFLQDRNYSFIQGFCEGYTYVQIDHKTGVIDRNGEFLVEPIFNHARSGFGYGLLGVQDFESYRWGFIDTTGQVAIDFQFGDVSKFREGKCFVQDEFGEPGYFIDTSGKRIWKQSYDDAWGFRRGLCAVELGDKYGVIDSTGQQVVPFNYDWIAVFYRDGWISFYTKTEFGTCWGALNEAGEEIIPAQYEATYHQDGECPLIEVRSGVCPGGSNNCIGYVNLRGEMVWELN